jgi:hypothetical protein
VIRRINVRLALRDAYDWRPGLSSRHHGAQPSTIALEAVVGVME